MDVERTCTVKNYYPCCLCCSYRSTIPTNDLTPYLILLFGECYAWVSTKHLFKGTVLSNFTTCVLMLYLSRYFCQSSWTLCVYCEWTPTLSADTFIEICVNFPCKPAEIKKNKLVGIVGSVGFSFVSFFLLFGSLSWYTHGPLLCCGPQEPEENPQVPARMGASAEGEDYQGALWWLPGPQDGVHVQAQLLQDGVRLQVWRLHVQAYSAHTGAWGGSEQSFCSVLILHWSSIDLSYLGWGKTSFRYPKVKEVLGYS